MGADGSRGSVDAPWRIASAQVVVDDLGDPVLDDAGRHHLGRVLRLRAGESVCASDGRGGYRMCIHRGDGELEATAEVVRTDPPLQPVTVGFVAVKGDRPEWAVQKLTELGVDRIVVLRSQRSVVRWEGRRGEAHLDKLRGTARAATQQCRRLWLPEVALADLGDTPGALADAGGRGVEAADTTILVGPEGGWTDEERHGRELVALGQNILRTETAAVAAGVLLTSRNLGRGPRGSAMMSR